MSQIPPIPALSPLYGCVTRLENFELPSPSKKTHLFEKRYLQTFMIMSAIFWKKFSPATRRVVKYLTNSQ